MVEKVFAFIDYVNSHDIEGLGSLLSEEYLYIDPKGNFFKGRDKIKEALTQYFKWFPDYRIECSLLLKEENVIGLFGCASGTPLIGGTLDHCRHWSIPAAWRITFREGLISEWQVYCETGKILDIIKEIKECASSPGRDEMAMKTR